LEAAEEDRVYLVAVVAVASRRARSARCLGPTMDATTVAIWAIRCGAAMAGTATTETFRPTRHSGTCCRSTHPAAHSGTRSDTIRQTTRTGCNIKVWLVRRLITAANP